jgi:hypothetical protein
MLSTYITLLTIALASLFVYLRTSEDVPSVLAAFSGVLCFVWGFAVAPWGVQILIMGVLFGVERIYFADIRATR